ncbi:hypothetical protein HY30_18315 [Hyphomonas chukchiensis]|uniref:Uncharacterized protein n=1 Tax=Hyphomonas chukchiensis TaxID=1280947 RepID=A0A062UJV2_9PROT|nr:hypothetical protein [Hyphomonas chukchiensis]KCZ56859.1 hypothetical protein HY30_18315 [Hyphomonas chukchiensis]
MRVDDGADVAGLEAGCILHGLQHVGGEVHVEERIDEQRLIAIGDEPRI